jgi:hypothetical protein
MDGFKTRFVRGVMAVSLVLGQGLAYQAFGDGQQTDSSRIGPDGTAYVTRVVPVPTTISPEAQKVLARVVSDAAVPQTLEQRRAGTSGRPGPVRSRRSYIQSAWLRTLSLACRCGL